MCNRGVYTDADCHTHVISIPVMLDKFWNFRERLATFIANWPKFLQGPSIEDLARSGFVYQGFSDRVKCFSCGLILRDWEPCDEALKEHIRWAPECKFIRMLESEDPGTLKKDVEGLKTERGYDYPG